MALGLTFVGGFTNDDVVYCALPLYHSNGGVLATGQLLLNGSTLVVRRKFSASQFWNDCIKYRCTAIIYIGEFCRYLLAQPPRATDKQHMVRLASGNGLRKHIWKQFQERFNIQHIREFYGSTEGNSNLLNVEGIPGACGFKSLLIPMAIPVYVVKVDPETEEIVRNENGFCVEAPYNEPGELIGQIKDNFLRRFDGYHNKEATNKKILTDVFKKGDKYFRTGDMLYMDERGTLYFADRTGDTFRWKGENVSTSEVETLMAQVLTKEIHVAVYGVEIPKTEGRAGMAVIESDPETCKISKLAGNLYDVLPAYSVPLFLRFVDQIEMTGTHKYKKTTYRKEGFNVETIKDPIYVLQNKVYVPLTSEIYQSILNGTWRV
jgi:solute carrier family 27 fatty acid transporter 1/4